MTENTYNDPDFDAMPGRALAARWVLTATPPAGNGRPFRGPGGFVARYAHFALRQNRPAPFAGNQLGRGFASLSARSARGLLDG